jgi:hypothetical protein
MSMNVSMRLDTGEQKRVKQREAQRVRPRPTASTPCRRRSRQLIIALALVILAGFLLGLGVPIHQ